jgi:hypothetical protein
MRTSARSWKSTVDSIVGDNYDAMKEMESEVSTAKEKKMREDAPNNLPLGRLRPSGGRISDEEKDYFSKVEELTGRKIDPKEWLAEEELGDDEDSWLPYIAKMEGTDNAA